MAHSWEDTHPMHKRSLTSKHIKHEANTRRACNAVPRYMWICALCRSHRRAIGIYVSLRCFFRLTFRGRCEKLLLDSNCSLYTTYRVLCKSEAKTANMLAESEHGRLAVCSQVCVTDAMSQLTLTFEVEKNNERGWAIQVFKFCFTKRLQKSYSKILLEQKKFLVLIIVSKNSEWDEMTEK